MELDIKINDRLTKVKQLSRVGNHVVIKVDDRLYDIDLSKVEKNEYSVLYKGQSHNIEVIDGESPKKFIANTYFSQFDVEIIDAETRYQQNRNKGQLEQSQNTIASPMPGKVVRILVKPGDKVEAGQTCIVVSAMKMESEYKSTRDAIIKKVMVAEGDIVKSHQSLITLE